MLRVARVARCRAKVKVTRKGKLALWYQRNCLLKETLVAPSKYPSGPGNPLHSPRRTLVPRLSLANHGNEAAALRLHALALASVHLGRDDAPPARHHPQLSWSFQHHHHHHTTARRRTQHPALPRSPVAYQESLSTSIAQSEETTSSRARPCTGARHGILVHVYAAAIVCAPMTHAQSTH